MLRRVRRWSSQMDQATADCFGHTLALQVSNGPLPDASKSLVQKIF